MLTGSIPELSELNDLFVLDLSNNKLSGNIPLSIGKMKNLVELLLHKNLLKGDLSFLREGKMKKLMIM